MNIITGNLLDHKGIIYHQVNAIGVMRAGLALQIRRKWPIVYDDYRKWLDEADRLGDALVTWVEGTGRDKVCVASLCAQHDISRERIVTAYDALNSALEKLRYFLFQSPDSAFAFPYKLGCGLAGGNWNVVLPILERHFPEGLIYKLPE